MGKQAICAHTGRQQRRDHGLHRPRHDRVGRQWRQGGRIAHRHREVSNQLGTAIIEAGTAYSLGLSFERKTTSASRFSDHSPFWDGGYPAVLAIENFYTDDIPADHSPWYHHSGDTLERVDLDYVLAHARTALATIAELAGAAETIEVPTPTPTEIPEPATATPTPRPTGCTELLNNGGWETATASVAVTFTPTLVPTATPTPASVIVSPTSVELDLHSGETQATITFDNAGISRPWKARALASWISMPIAHGTTGEGMQFLINPPGLPRPTGMTQTATLTASSSISITFGVISDTVSVDVTISFDTFDLIFLPIISGHR